jgi:hypothetical protein
MKGRARWGVIGLFGMSLHAVSEAMTQRRSRDPVSVISGPRVWSFCGRAMSERRVDLFDFIPDVRFRKLCPTCVRAMKSRVVSGSVKMVVEAKAFRR